MSPIFRLLILFVFMNSCSEYQKVFKAEGEDAIARKFKLGEDLYNEGKYTKANRLFAQIVPNYRGKPQAEKLMFLYSDSFYKMKDFYVASYQFDRFVTSYPESEKVEQAAFLSAESASRLSPIYSKSQTETKEAIEKLQTFINNYPNSEFISNANKIIKALDFKLEKKAYEIAKQYNHISDYPASVKSFDNFIFEYPGSSLREDAYFYRLDSAYKLALNSVEVKRNIQKDVIYIKKVRLEEAKEYSNAFKKSYATSKYIEKVNAMEKGINEELKSYSTKS